MQLESVEKHIQEIQRKRAKLFVQSLDFINNYYNNSRNYYLVTLLLSVVMILSGISLFFSFEFNVFIKISLFFSTISFLFALINYLNSLEKSSEKMGKIFSNLDLKYKQEINIFRGFYSGRINEDEVRNFYLKADTEINERYFINQYEIILRWINFILLSLAIIMILLNFF
ncbi:MAG: hypothetical protein RBS77_06640 [Candidatus Moranbacteria bacterium]|jgi:hypothetical protein|nr:hypothetical protein [Candidatus Moranbacteria bacterium]